jgi:hypothetical protein
MKNKTVKTVKINLNSHFLLEELRLTISKNKRVILTKKYLLEWLIKKASEEIKKINTSNQ